MDLGKLGAEMMATQVATTRAVRNEPPENDLQTTELVACLNAYTGNIILSKCAMSLSLSCQEAVQEIA